MRAETKRKMKKAKGYVCRRCEKKYEEQDGAALSVDDAGRVTCMNCVYILRAEANAKAKDWQNQHGGGANATAARIFSE